MKLADDGSGDVVIRLYEAHGDRATVVIKAETTAAWRAALTEEPLESIAAGEGGLTVSLRPFELATVRVRTEGSPQTADGQSLTAKA